MQGITSLSMKRKEEDGKIPLGLNCQLHSMPVIGFYHSQADNVHLNQEEIGVEEEITHKTYTFLGRYMRRSLTLAPVINRAGISWRNCGRLIFTGCLCVQLSLYLWYIIVLNIPSEMPPW